MKNPILEAGIPVDPGVLLLAFQEEPTLLPGVLVVGSDEGTLLALREGGSIISLDASTHEMVRFVNTSAIAFADCIRVYSNYGACIAGCSSELEEVECVKIFEANLRNVDPAAITDPENWWSCIVEQANDGLF